MKQGRIAVRAIASEHSDASDSGPEYWAAAALKLHRASSRRSPESLSLSCRRLPQPPAMSLLPASSGQQAAGVAVGTMPCWRVDIRTVAGKLIHDGAC